MIYSGAVNEMAVHEGYYQTLVEKCMGKCNLATDEIGNLCNKFNSKLHSSIDSIDITVVIFSTLYSYTICIHYYGANLYVGYMVKLDYKNVQKKVTL